MNIPLSNIVSASDVQRDYRKVFDLAKKTKQAVMVLCGNTPDVAIVDSKVYEEEKKRLEKFEIADTLRVIKEAEEEYRSGKMKSAKSLADLLK